MLNELYTLDRSLRRFHVAVEASHRWVKRVKRADLLIAGVDSSGFVTQVEPIGKEDAVSLFNIQKNYHANFPQVNWSAPLWDLDENSAEVKEWQACPAKNVVERARLLRKACSTAPVHAGQDRAIRRTREFCEELRQRFRRNEEEEFAAFSTLLNRILGGAAATEDWVRHLSDAALTCAEAGPEKMLAAVEPLLAGKEEKVPLFFDLADCTTFQCRVASPRMGGYYSRTLNATEAAGEGRGRCALSGVEMPLEQDKLPSPRLPVLGDTVLMSMNRDTPCQTRYRRIGMEIFPIGKQTASVLNTALVHLTSVERAGKNWTRIPGTTRKKSNLLLVYLEWDPLRDAELAEYFSGTGKPDRVYEKLSEAVCEALQGRKAADSDLLRLFVLNKIDPGRVQVELSETFTAEQVIQGAAEWREGARNRPGLLPALADLVPSPGEVMRCLQMQWERGGKSYADAPGCRLAEVYDVLIAGRPDAKRPVRALLAMTLRRISDLLMGIGHASHRGTKEAWKAISRESGKYPAIAVSLLGITLNKLEQRKENYMQEPAFLIGRFLSLVDTLHNEYCKGVRKGETPPQLLGNSLIPTAISDANKGLARMLLRIRPYQAWAKKSGTGLARWTLGEIGGIAKELEGKLPGRRLNDAEQAQLLLGYLARSEKGEEGAN